MANYVLEILDGDRAGEVLPVTDRLLRIGRKSGNDIVLADEKTSGVHCEIAPEGDRLVLKDLGSTNGTFLDGKRITEIVLTPGDVVTVGRLRVKFRQDGEEAAAESDEFAIRTLDAARLQKRGSSVGLIAVLVLVLAGGGGWYWWQGQQQAGGEGGETTTRKKREVLSVPGNRLDKDLAGCEQDEGFELLAAGAGFRAAGSAHTGSGAFVAMRAVDDEGESSAADKVQHDYAVMRLQEPIKVSAGRSMTIAGHCLTRGDAKIAVRARVSGADENSPFEFTVGSAMTASDDWQKLEAGFAVPSGCDQLMVEVVALLPSDEAEAYVDDLAITEGGSVDARELRLEESGQAAIGFGSALAVRSTDLANPATMLRLLPAQVPAEMQALHAAGLCELSDLGATLTCEAGERSFQIRCDKPGSVRLVFPADAASGLLVAGADGKFASTAATSQFAANKLLLGHGATRALVQFAEAANVTGKVAGGRYRVDIDRNEFELVLGFRAARNTADEHLRTARTAANDGRPGEALDELRTLLQEAPMDSQLLAEANQLRSEILSEQTKQLQALQRDLDQAAFFSTRGGFERVASGVSGLQERYGKHNLEDPESIEQLRQTAEARMRDFDTARQGATRERLKALADAFAESKHEGLQKVVENYIEEHLPAAPEEAPPEEGSGESGENPPDENGAGGSGSGGSGRD